MHLHRKNSVIGTIHQLSSSKSISNRALLLKALSGSQSIVENLSTARDTQLMLRLVDSAEKTIDVLDAGTTMRFLTAYFALSGKNKIMTGTDRMKERPIGLLVVALRKLGATIDYLGVEGFPPMEIKGFGQQLTSEIEIPGNVSSQYISALMMVAPILPKGLTIKLRGDVGSVPYIRMTASLMEEFGVHPELNFEKGFIKIENQSYRTASVTVEADWSSASYWFGFAALAEQADVILPNVSEKSLQGDRVIVEVMDQVGVQAQFENGNVRLTKKESAKHLIWDFKDCPDLAQTVLPACAAKGISGEFTGLESLRIKETDRIAALQSELKKIGAELTEPVVGKWHLSPGKIPNHTISISTYHDHRMAMGFAPWAALTDLKIEAPEVVNKSYPTFWDDLQAVGFEIKREGN
ncbi:MAG: 3-phosphoshikimate 1-carboxyvinyltransferase [Cyclobacteriaceae bacterium]|nr:3-phosphoshikimate 1-carboxyvinyltransferase [Cyclobacteriaceae bacterium]